MSGYKYKVIVNSNSIEIFDYAEAKPFTEGINGDIESREPNGMKRGKQWVNGEYVDLETGEIVRGKINVKESLEYKRDIRLITQEQYEEKKLKSLKNSRARAISECRRKIDNNLFTWGEIPKFVTLTYRDHVTERDEAYQHFKQFIKRLNYNLSDVGELQGKKKQWLKWLTVIEHTKKGRIHFHTIFFNLPFTKAKAFEKIWSHGYIKMNAISLLKGDDDIRKVTGYMMKYIMKEQIVDIEESIKNGKAVTEKGKKFYFASRNLKKQKEILLKENEEHILKNLLGKEEFEKKYETEFNNIYSGVINYKQYFKVL